MKYLWFYEVNQGLLEKWLKIQPKYAEEFRNEEKYGKRIAQYVYKSFKGVSIIEFNNYKQLYNRIVLSNPYITMKPIPCIEGSLAREVRGKINKFKES